MSRHHPLIASRSRGKRSPEPFPPHVVKNTMLEIGTIPLIAAIVVAYLFVNCVIQSVAVLLYVRRVLVEVRQPTPSLPRWPRISVFVPVRGGGHDWQVALEHLLSADYPDFHVFVVVD